MVTKTSNRMIIGAATNIKDFGAVGDGVTDDTAAFQAALDAAKGEDGTGTGRTVTKLIISKPDNFYRISDTLVIDGTHGLTIESDYALVHREQDGDSGAYLKWFGSNSKPIFQVKGGAGVPSNPNFYIKISGLTMDGNPAARLSPTVNRSNAALAGILVGLGAWDTSQNVVNRQVVIENCSILSCRFGIWGGNYHGGNTDTANVKIDTCGIRYCSQAGIWWGTGNAVAHVTDSFIYHCGWAPETDTYSANGRGANIHLFAGYMDITNHTSSGYNEYTPKDGDIYQNFGHMTINGAWSDTHGLFFNQSSGSSAADTPTVLSGIRHYEGSMDATNTPDSLRIRVPGTCVQGSSVYGNILVESGLSGRPVFTGIKFIRADATFKGSGVDTQHSIINIGNAGNHAQIMTGGGDSDVEFKHKGVLTPQYLQVGVHDAGQYQTAATRQMKGGKVDDAVITEWVDGATGALYTCHNCYMSSNNPWTFTPTRVGQMTVTEIGGGSSGIRIRQYYSADGTTPVTIDTFIESFRIKAGPGAYGSQYAVKIPVRSSDPSYGDQTYWEGCIYMNSSTNKIRMNNGTGWKNAED